MTPVEKLTAAIEKLERLKSERGYVEFNGWLAEPNPGDTARSWLEPRDDLSPITDDELIVTLHRMAGPVLDALRSALDWLMQGNNAPIAAGSSIFAAQIGPELALADAILGTEMEGTTR